MGEILTVCRETDILGKRIKMYGSIELPFFRAKDVAEWIDYSKSNGKYRKRHDKQIFKGACGIWNQPLRKSSITWGICARAENARNL